ncbi:hypothetical protein SELMODRAFT_402040 [Selaginella moellendorffii]|uniref:HTH myb-type domain-containing protein n=1 Tax=Selaginella moellendorffii TaxID=88036 RepID=D8QPE3_SELML|nr:transcription factor HHO2 [Selaginella moellendorffii]EFJ37607.1 hypothetical protein SELMODRAFT_402040 [Selaginella moellendorffii]|eukprot:XP_002960068.1 transcription factor HHO2 [Selaginella moellendorffii]
MNPEEEFGQAEGPDLTLGCAIAKRDSSDQQTRRRMEDYLQALQQERQKIEAFKRELPCCMNLLDQAIQSTRGCLDESYKTEMEEENPPKLELFLENRSGFRLGKPKSEAEDHRDFEERPSTPKQNWMQLACFPSQSPREDEEFETRKALRSSTASADSGAFAPFVRDKKWDQAELCLSSSICLSLEQKKTGFIKFQGNESNLPLVELSLQQMPSSGICSNSTLHQQRKARRCWSPELHRRFVNALQQLGGSQVATPKQIRELMKVDGLTNDEVKSHLQKYRLHTRRPATVAPGTAAQKSPQVVVLGSIWVPPEYAVFDHHQAAPSMQSTPLQQSKAQDFFANLHASPAEPMVFYEKQELLKSSKEEGEVLSPRKASATTASEEEDDGDVTEAEEQR